MSKIIMEANDSILELTPHIMEVCEIGKDQAAAVVNAIERARHAQFGTVGKVKKAVETEEGRKALLDILHLGPKRLGYLMRTLDEVEVTLTYTGEKPFEELVEETIPNNERKELMDNFINEQSITILKRSTIGRVTIYLKEPVNGSCSNEIRSDYLKSRPVGEHPFYTEYYLDNTDEFIHPVGLKIVDNDEFMPGFVRVSTESGYSITIAKDAILMMETEMFPVEE